MKTIIAKHALKALPVLLAPALIFATPVGALAEPPVSKSAAADGLRQSTPLQPNFLVILVDDLGFADVGFNGGELPTPNIDRIAKDGMRLDHFYTTAVCSPTRAGLLTGRYPHRFGIMGDVVRPWSDFGLDTNEKTLAQVLQQAGYDRRSFLGKWHLGHRQAKYHPLNFGFTSFYGQYNGAIDFFSKEREGQPDWHRDHTPVQESGYSTDLLAEEAVRIINAPAQDGKPWLMWLAFNGVHAPFQAADEDLQAVGFDASKHLLDVQPGQREAPDYGQKGRGNSIRQTSLAMIRGVDRGVGRILTALEATGQMDNTLILFLSDNGGPIADKGTQAEDIQANNGHLRGTKAQHYEGGVRVAAAISWPKGFQPRASANVGALAYVDVLPTFARLANASLPRSVDGLDVSQSLISGEAVPPRAIFIGEDYSPKINANYIGPRDPEQLQARSRSVVDGPWKLVGAELYNLDLDPSEKTDLAASHPEIVERLNKKALEFMALRTVPFERLNAANLPPVPNWRNPK